MGWFKAFARTDAADALGPRDVTAIDGAPFDVDNAFHGGAETAAFRGEGPATQIDEETRRRQLALMQRYVVAIRAR